MTNHKLTGGCHCGNVTFALSTCKNVDDFVPRTCQCSLCKKHDASWISDPEGEVHLHYQNREEISAYRFGTATSDFIVCKKCGVLTVALCEIAGVLRAVLNIKSMLDHKFTQQPVLTNFDAENVAERLARRGRNWTGKVVVFG